LIDRVRAGWARWSAWQPLSALTLGRLAVAAVFVRLVYIVRVIPGYVPNADARNYYYLALHFSQGLGVSDTFPLLEMHHTAFRPPAYPVLLGSVFAVTGDSIGVAQAVNVAIGTLVVVLGAVLAARLAGRVAGVAAGLVIALYPPIIANDTTVLTEPLSLLFVVIIGLALSGAVRAEGDERKRWKDPAIVVAGVATGLLTLSRPSAQGLAVVLAAWVWWRVGWRRAGVLLAATFVVVAPWLIRNQIQMGSPVLVTTNGFNLASRYSPPAKHDDAFIDAISDPRTADVHYLIFDEVELDDAFSSYAWKELRKDPSYVLHVTRENAAIWFEIDPKKGLPAEKADGRDIDFRTNTRPLFFVVTIAGLVGLVWQRRKAASQYLLLIAFYFTATSLPLLAWPRLRAPFDLACCIGAGLAVAWARDRWQRRRGGAPPDEDTTDPGDEAGPVIAEPTLTATP
jgi:4-amino-4-deoxy-L-arabinose transferase-like glycosyltransferase